MIRVPIAWVTDTGRRSYRLDKFLDVMGDVMARRDVEPSDAYVERMKGLHLDSVSTGA